MNAVNNKTDNALKKSHNGYIKTSATENECNKWENSQPQIENPDDTENKIKIEEIKQNIIKFGWLVCWIFNAKSIFM